MALLQATDIRKAFGGIQALDSCSITVERGSITGLIGPNGSGKTTLFNVITGYERSDTGKVEFNGLDISRYTPNRIFGMGMGRTFQLTRIFPRLTVTENMHVAIRRKGLASLLGRWSASSEHARALQLLEFVGLTHLRDTPAGSLSYGQRKLLELAFILIAEPQMVLLDEPAGGINPTLIDQLGERIRELNRQGVTFLIVEHNMEFIMGLCNRVMVMHRGAKLAEGAPEAVRANPAVLEAYLGD
ncbi:MAG TPA: ABC transporter ATP-binding protein [Ktedonobacterales bacterium]|jgi:neutral amino acid transport system ATP-binding protein|nr:ABC transporter ATP-binding protein [Ktedonobacterales bacterium]